MLTRRGLLMTAPALLISPAHAQMCNKMGFCNPAAPPASPPSYIDPYWPNVKLIMSFDSGFADESSYKHGTPTIIGNMQIRNTYSVFGGNSAYFSGTSSFTFPDDEDWNLSNRKFTIEFWLRQSSTGLDYIVGQWRTAGNYGWIIDCSNALAMLVSTDGTNQLGHVGTGTIVSANKWYAACIDFDGVNYRAYIDGVTQATYPTLRTIYNSTDVLTFGGGNGNKPYTGYLDEFRLTMDVARYASDSGYTVTTQPFPRG
jgi:hypothetical protein